MLAQSVGIRLTDRSLGFIEKVANELAKSASELATGKKRGARRSVVDSLKGQRQCSTWDGGVAFAQLNQLEEESVTSSVQRQHGQLE